jgi:glutaredoxin-like protein
MPLLTEHDRKQLADRFRDLREDVHLLLFTQEQGPLGPPAPECDLCRETRELAEELAAASERVHLEIHDFLSGDDAGDDPTAADLGIERIPALVPLGHDHTDRGIRFYGIPAGYEFATIVTDLIRLSNDSPDLARATTTALATLDADVTIKVFVTPTCPFCPGAVYLAHQMAMASPRITAEAIEATEFPELVNRYGVMGVPKIVVNETNEVEGAVPEQVLLDMIIAVGKAA